MSANEMKPVPAVLPMEDLSYQQWFGGRGGWDVLT
jgi:hypothetical protein